MFEIAVIVLLLMVIVGEVINANNIHQVKEDILDELEELNL